MGILSRIVILNIAMVISSCHQHERVGSKRDAHGCILSAGYIWDSDRNECLRPWESSPESNQPELKNQ